MGSSVGVVALFEYSNHGENISLEDSVGSGRGRDVSRERGGAEGGSV